MSLTNKFYFQAEAQERALANADAYGNLKAKSYLRLALQEPIIPETVFEVKQITNKIERLTLDSELSNTIILYPNPTSSNAFQINLQNSISKSRIKVTNSIGQVIYFNDFYQSEDLIEMYDAIPGIYFVDVQFNNEGKETGKVLKLIISND